MLCVGGMAAAKASERKLFGTALDSAMSTASNSITGLLTGYNERSWMPCAVSALQCFNSLVKQLRRDGRAVGEICGYGADCAGLQPQRQPQRRKRQDWQPPQLPPLRPQPPRRQHGLLLQIAASIGSFGGAAAIGGCCPLGRWRWGLPASARMAAMLAPEA